MSKLLEILLVDNERIVLVLGLHGMGKSGFVRNTLHYVADRKIFTGCILFVDLGNKRTNFAMIKLIMQSITESLDVTHEEKLKIFEDNFTQEDMIEYLRRFFNKKLSTSYRFKKEKSKGNNSAQNQLFLICLDNVSTLIEHNREEFVQFLSLMYNECPNLRIIITSNSDIGHIPNNNMVIKPYLLQQLKDSDSVRLFLENCKEISSEEILELILVDKNFPYNLFLSSLRDYDSNSIIEVTPELKNELRRKVSNSMNWTPMLAHHDMFRHLHGNPTSITMMASIH